MENMIIQIDDIPDSYRQIANIVGIDAFIKLCKIFGGNSMYFPTARSVLKPIRDKNIKREFNGSNLRELSMKYEICETQIRKILFK